jgi:hypothetical protein
MRVEVGLLYRVGETVIEQVKPTDGKKFTLKELQKFVGGFIEHVPGSRPIAYCNEEGRLTGLPPNAIASVHFNQVLLGDVIQVKTEKR